MNGLKIVGVAVLALHLPRLLATAAEPTPPPAATVAPMAVTPASSVGAAKTFVESTKVGGKVDGNLTGVWLLAAWFPIGKEDNYRTIPQLLRITNGKDGLQFHILDLELPEGVQQELKKANQGRPPHVAWVPSAGVLKALADQWKQLPRRAIRGPGDSIYGTVDFVVVAPDQYEGVFGTRAPQMDKVLEGSKFAIQINEKYKPQQLPADARTAQLITRRSVYGVKTVEREVLKGDQATGFVSVGGGTPLPINLPGTFGMYRISQANRENGT